MYYQCLNSEGKWLNFVATSHANAAELFAGAADLPHRPPSQERLVEVRLVDGDCVGPVHKYRVKGWTERHYSAEEMS